MKKIDLSKVRTYPINQRSNLVTLHDLVTPESLPPDFTDSRLQKVAHHIITSRSHNRPVIWMMGAHVIKSGLSRVLVNLLQRGLVTHVAGNGAVSIHDFELALIGETSEDVATSLEDGTFGMAHETGALMHQAIREGVRDGLGYGAAVGRFMDENPDQFPFRDVSVLYQAYKLGIPVTIHVTIGADIIHQHPDANFTAIGTASGLDFSRFITAVCDLEGGVFLNFGSAVTGPEVFLKSLTIARNLGYKIEKITTANFDLLPLSDATRPMGYDEPLYYYRPRKNIVIRPTSLGGQGYHITGDHRVTIPNLYHQVVKKLKTSADSSLEPMLSTIGYEVLHDYSPPPVPSNITAITDKLVIRQPALSCVIPDLLRAYNQLVQCFLAGGTLFLCGNGGSMSDALHISGELLKSYNRHRVLPEHIQKVLSNQPDGAVLVRSLEPGLRAVVLGINTSLSTAVANDMQDRDVGFSQELIALARPGDVLMGISTSGNAHSVAYAAQTARALGLSVIALTGESGGKLTALADVTLKMPFSRTDRVQEYHIVCYHALCEMLEEHFF